MGNKGNDEFEKWFGDCQAIARKVARAFTQSAEDREDLIQEILLRVWSSRSSFRAESKVSTWIYRIALNRALTWRRDADRKPSSVPIDTEITGRSAEAESQTAEKVERLYEAIRALGEVDRALVLLALENCSYQEIAEIMGTSANLVGVRLNRAKKKLGELMRSNDGGL